MMEIKEHKLKTLLRFSIPSIIAMLLQTAITITDGYFTGNFVGETALAAINLGLPILYLYLGIGLCIGVGGTVICGKMLGAKDRQKASEVFSQTIATAAMVCILLSLAVWLLFSPIITVLKAEGDLSLYFTQYYRMMLMGYPLMVLSTILSMFVRLDGKPEICMMVSIASCMLNMLFDYIFMGIFLFGITGSAIASLIVQIFAILAQIMYFSKASSHIVFTSFRFDRAVTKETLLNGASELIGEMASAISMFAYNFVLMKYVGVEGVAAFTVLGFAIYGYSMITIGFGQGLTPLVSVCFGAKEYEPAIKLRGMTNRLLFGIGALFAIIFWLFGRQYATLFGCSMYVAEMVSSGFRFLSISFLLMGYNVTNSMYFTSCGDALRSAMISFLRGIALLLAFVLIFPAIWGMTGVWMAAPAAEALTAIVSTILIVNQKSILEGR